MRYVTNLAALLRVDFPSNITFMQPEKYGLEKHWDLQRKDGVKEFSFESPTFISGQ